MSMPTIDNPSAQLAIAFQLHDLDELETLGTVDEEIIRIQRQQLEIDSGFDAVTFEASRRLALSIAKAVEEDSSLLAQSTNLPPIDDGTFDRLRSLNHVPPTSTNGTELALKCECSDQMRPLQANHHKRARSVTPEDETSLVSMSSQSHKRGKYKHVTSEQNARNQVVSSELPSVQDTPLSSADADCTGQTKPLQANHHKRMRSVTPEDELSSALISSQSQKRLKYEPIIGGQNERNQIHSVEIPSVQDPPPPSADAVCESCREILTDDKLVKASCKHRYCKDCFESFIGARLETQDGFPPTCCKVPFAFDTVAHNVSAEIFASYSARQDEIKNATALYCSIRGCGVRIEEDRIHGVIATCVVCRRDTCTLCRTEYPLKVKGKKVDHVCKKDLAREQLLALAREEGWQTCYYCGNLVALNTGCHHMTCRCKAEFCYPCGTKWKNCDCGDYDQPRLEARAIAGIRLRARRRIERGLPPDLRPQEEQQRELQQRLQVDCDHNNFWYEGGKTPTNPGHCQICEYEGWKYIMRCDNCRFTACKLCHTSLRSNADESPLDISSWLYNDDENDENSDSEPTTEDESI